MKSGSIRIIGGKWRGRKLTVIDKEGLRPTTDRIKETLFNWLMPIIHDSNCLDCFSGSGSLAFEAQSRGAKQVTLLEHDPHIVQQLLKNKQLVQSEELCIYHVDALIWLGKPAINQFNIVFIDPPFYKSLVAKTIIQLECNNWLAPQAYIYIEVETGYNISSYIPNNWRLHRDKIAGQVHCYLFIRESL